MATSITNTSISTDTINVDNGVLYVDNVNNRVGVGTTSPSYPLHISGTGHKRLKIEKTDSGGDADLQLSSPNDSTQWILFHDRNSGNNSGVIKYVHSTNKMHFRTNDVDDRLVISSDGNVGIGTTNPAGALHVGSGDIVFGSGGEQPGNGNTQTGAGFRDINTGSSVMFSVSRNDGNTCRFNRNGVAGSNINMSHDGGNIGSIDTSTTGTTYNTTSDRRLKDNIVTIADGKEKLLAMNPVTHTWKAEPDAPAVHGFIAQEMQTVIPEAVQGTANSEEMMSMDYGRITPVIVAALQDALNEIQDLKTRISELENKQ